jgi:hypothetical protein
MLQIQYENERWKSPTIVPYGDLRISPAASALHYGMECFEGMKAYRALKPSSSSSSLPSSSSSNVDDDHNTSIVVVKEGHDVDLRLFRPEKNMERLRNSMKRLGMPGTDFDTNEVIECIKELVRLGECILIERKMMRKYNMIMHLVCVCVCVRGGEGGYIPMMYYLRNHLSLSLTHILHTHSVPRAHSLSLSLLLIMKTIKSLYHRLQQQQQQQNNI